MDVAVSYTMDSAHASAAVHGLRKFELIRGATGCIACIVGLAVVNLVDVDPVVRTPGDIVLGVVLLVFAVLAVNWLRIAARVRRAAPAYTKPTTVTITDDGLKVVRAGAVAAKIAWTDVSHGTSVADTWVFALKGGQGAVLIPSQQLAAGDRDQVLALVGSWPKRRFRFIPY